MSKHKRTRTERHRHKLETQKLRQIEHDRRLAALNSDRVIYLEGGDEKTVLACFEEGLRHGGLGAAVAEVARLPMTASRRLQLAGRRLGVSTELKAVSCCASCRSAPPTEPCASIC